MEIEDIDLLVCVDCGSNLRLIEYIGKDGIILDGLVACMTCFRQYPILDQVGIFFKKEVLQDYFSEKEILKIRNLGYFETLHGSSSRASGHKRQLRVKKNWEYQWLDVKPIEKKDLDQDDLFGNKMFWTFIPLESAQMTGKTVFIGCAGQGREAYHVSKLNPKKILVNEIGSEIYGIANLIPGSDRRLVLLRSDLNYLPVKREVSDITICDHALQHVPDHKRAFAKMAEITKFSGRVSICVYSRENNGVMIYLIEPLKKILRLLPLRLLRLAAFFPATAVFLLIHGFYMPLSKINSRLAVFLPLFDHMAFWSKNTFETVWVSCFDLMHAPISYHFSEAELKEMVRSNHMELVKLINTHGTTWSLVAQVNG